LLAVGLLGALVVFLFFSAQTFRLFPGCCWAKKVTGLSVTLARRQLNLFYINPILPGLGVLFAGLFCLDCYMRERSRAWLFLAALLFVALIEVKMLIAVQLMCSLALAAVVYLIIFSKADLFKIGGRCTAIGRFPGFAGCCSRTERRTDRHKFEPWLYVLHAMQMLGWASGERSACFRGCSAANLLVGVLGSASLAFPHPHCIFRPRQRALSDLASGFLCDRRVIALTCSFTPAGWTFRYTQLAHISVQSEYVAWIFAVEVFQTFYQWATRRGIYPALAVEE